MSNTTMVEAVASTSIFTSMALPSPMKLWASGAWRFWSIFPVQKPPAVSSRASSSSRVWSVAVCSLVKQSAFSPTSTARSCSVSLCNSSIGTSWENPSNSFYYSIVSRLLSRERGKNPAGRYKKSVPLLAVRTFAYFRPNLLLKRSTRPPVSTSFCLPV